MRRTLRVMLWIVAAIALALAAFAAYVRFAGDDPQVWHVDPTTAKERGALNDFIVTPDGADADIASPVFAMAPNALMARFRELALSRPRTTILGERDGFATFVQRTKLMAYPDYISVRAVEAEGGSALYIYSRSRYGRSDLGVNKKRLLAWLDKI